MIGEFCIFRTYSAGVHMGWLAERAGTEAVVRDARRLYSWAGAFTLSEVSQDGVGEKSRISQPVPLILLTQVIEVIPCSEKATKNLTRSRNGA